MEALFYAVPVAVVAAMVPKYWDSFEYNQRLG